MGISRNIAVIAASFALSLVAATPAVAETQSSISADIVSAPVTLSANDSSAVGSASAGATKETAASDSAAESVNETPIEGEASPAVSEKSTEGVLESSNGVESAGEDAADGAEKNAATTTQASSSVGSGLYTISSAIDDSERIEIAGGDTSNGGKVQVYSDNCTPAQRWNLVSLGNGYYRIANVNSGLVLDVAGAATGNGSTVQQYAWNGTDAQMWALVSAGSNSAYRIVSRLGSTWVLDLSGASALDGGRVQLWSSNGTSAQEWIVQAIENELADGYYVVASDGSGNVLDVSGGSIEDGGNIQQYTANGTMAQTYYLSYSEVDGYYTVMSAASGKVFDVVGGSFADGANVQQYAANSTLAQKWVVAGNSDGTYTFRSALSGKALDVAGGSPSMGANIQVWTPNGTKAQKWVLTTVTDWLKDGIYNIICSNNHNNGLSIVGVSTDDGGNIATAARSEAAWSQKWYLENAGNGYYRILNLGSQKAIDIDTSTAKSGNNIYQWASGSGSDSQLWAPVLMPGGFSLHSKVNYSYVLDIACGFTSPGTNLQLYASNGTVAQKFLFAAAAAITNGAIANIRNTATGTVVDIAGASTANGSRAQLYESNGTGAQRFEFVSCGNDCYYIVNTNSGKYLDVDTNSNKVIQQWAGPGGASMKWHVLFDPATMSFSLENANNASLALNAYLSSTDGVLSLVDAVSGAAQRFIFIDAGNHMDGFDMASYQDGIDLAVVDCDFVIIKATQGTTYTNDTFKSYADQALALGKKLGLYHYANGSGAVAEANAFVNQITSYIGKSMLVLDWESNQNKADLGNTSYALTFLDTVYSLTGVRPLIYMSKSVTNEYDWTQVASHYALWVAQYPNYDSTGYQSDPWTDGNGTGAWAAPTIFQYSSTGSLAGYSGNLDLDLFYGDASAWDALAKVA